MSSNHKIEDSLREAIISQPDVILDDNDVMQALIAANERAMGGNIVDLRGIAMDRLETRLDRLEDTHRNVIAAAYENLADNWCTTLSCRAQLRSVGRDVSPTQDMLALLGRNPSKQVLDLSSFVRVVREKHHANAIGFWIR